MATRPRSTKLFNSTYSAQNLLPRINPGAQGTEPWRPKAEAGSADSLHLALGSLALPRVQAPCTPTLTLTPPNAEHSVPLPRNQPPRRDLRGAPQVQGATMAQARLLASHQMERSSSLLDALALATKNKPLCVPPMQVYKSEHQVRYEDLVIYAERISATEIIDERDRHYTLGPVFSSGSFGAVRLALKNDPVVDQVYVAKELLPETPAAALLGHKVPSHRAETKHMTPMSDEQVRNEVDIALILDHPLAPHAVLRTQDRDFLLIPQMDGDLFDLLAANTDTAGADEARAGLAVALLTRGSAMLAGFHAAGYAHRDVKLTNFLYERSGHVVLADLGLVAPITGSSDVDGTMEYMPFEALMMDRTSLLRGDHQDVWGLAATAVEVLTGYLLVPAMDDARTHGLDDPQVQAEIGRSFAAYSRVYEAYAAEVQAVVGPLEAPLDIADDQGYSGLLHTLWQQADSLFPTLLAALHPDPEARLSMAELYEDVAVYEAVADRLVANMTRDEQGQPLQGVQRKLWSDAQISGAAKAPRFERQTTSPRLGADW